MDQVTAIYDFWFDDIETLPQRYPEQVKIWYQKNPEFDAEIQQNFEPLIQKIADGELDRWQQSPQGYLASILCLDQFPRNCYRDSSQAYAYDAKAQDLCLRGVEEGIDQSISLHERMFFYLPLEHSEDKALQNFMIDLATDLVSLAPKSNKKDFQGFLDYAKRHQSIINKFGRFPHRNKILKRESSIAELNFLKQPGSSF